MAIWTVKSMQTAPQEDGLPDVVKRVFWLCTATDGVNESRLGGKTEVPLSTASFTPYDQLTQTQVIGWVRDVLGPQEVARIEASLQQQLADMANPPIVELPLPWAA